MLAKTDLTTELVKEFTELQGIVGGLYAKVQQLDPILPSATQESIGDAIYDQYKPESMDDSVPRSVEGAVLAIADKADSIAGMFALGLQPTGSKDPFALRRAANGIVKIIAEHKLPLPIEKLFSDARAEYVGSEAERRFSKEIKFDESIANFMRERLEFYLRDVRGFAYDVVNAVLAAGSDDIVDAIARAEAVSEVRGSEDFISISMAFKRIKNIVRQAHEQKRDAEAFSVGMEFKNPEVFEAGAERDLAMLVDPFLRDVKRFGEPKRRTRSPGARSRRCDSPVDAFFDKVMVMVDDERSGPTPGTAVALFAGEFLDHCRLQRDRHGRQVARTVAPAELEYRQPKGRHNHSPARECWEKVGLVSRVPSGTIQMLCRPVGLAMKYGSPRTHVLG